MFLSFLTFFMYIYVFNLTDYNKKTLTTDEYVIITIYNLDSIINIYYIDYGWVALMK